MGASRATIYVIDDDKQIRTLLGDLCHDAGLEVKLFGSTDEFSAEQLSAIE